MNGFVVDASVAVKWVVSETGSGAAARLRHHELAAPDLLGPECADILWKKARLGLITVDEAALAAAALERMEVTLHPSRPFIEQATILATKLDHPAYDCFYLSLALVLGQPLVTADRRLVDRLARADARVWQRHVVSLEDVPER